MKRFHRQFPRSVRRHIRQEKARIRRATLDRDGLKARFSELYAKFGVATDGARYAR